LLVLFILKFHLSRIMPPLMQNLFNLMLFYG
jgi:hypothetical protein